MPLTAPQQAERARKLALPRLRARSRSDARLWQVTTSSGTVAVVAATVTAAVAATASASSPASATRTTTAAVTATADTGLVVTIVRTASVVAAANTSSPAAVTRATTPVVVATASAPNGTVAATIARTVAAAATVSSPAALARSTTAGASAAANVSSPADAVRATTAAIAATARAPSPITGYRTTLTPQPARQRGAQLAFAAADLFNGMRFPNSGRCVLVFRNTSGSPVTCTVWYSPALDGAGHAIGRQVVVPPGTDTYTTAVFPPAAFNQDSGQVDLDFASAAGVSVAVVEGYRRW